MGDLMGAVLEIILEGSIEAAGDRRVPLPVRILLAGVLAAAVLGLSALLLLAGMDTGNMGLCALGAVFLLAAAVFCLSKARKLRRERRGRESAGDPPPRKK